jgi:ABC-type Fe3+-hydroxamate transport system substrate-binding protein
MRVVSLVPSLTEAVAVTLPGLLVGATEWCTAPADLDVPRVGGSKYPDLDRVRALRPDLVLLNVEENRREDAEALTAAGAAGPGHLSAYGRHRPDRARRPAA